MRSPYPYNNRAFSPEKQPDPMVHCFRLNGYVGYYYGRAFRNDLPSRERKRATL